MTEGDIIDIRRRAKESYHAGEMERFAELGFTDPKTNERAMRFVATCREDVIALADECLRLRKLLGESADDS